MALRSIFSRRTASDALRRMTAVVGVLDDDLADLASRLAEPLPARTLSDTEWQAAEAARVTVEHSLRELELDVAVATAQANDWRAKAVSAAERGDSPLADQARFRAAEADEIVRSYTQELCAVRVFLQEWAVRVARADSGRPSLPPASER
jgi:hypothetical protein